MRRVKFSKAEPSEKEFFEEYNKYTSLSPWFVLIFILKWFTPFCLAFQVSVFEHPENIKLYIKEYSIPVNSSDANVFWFTNCPHEKNQETFDILSEEVKDSDVKALVKCNGKSLVLRMTILKSVGFCFGALLGGVFSDLYGRRKITLYAAIFCDIFSWSLISISSKPFFETLFVCAVVFNSIVSVVSYVTFGEIANKSNRFIAVYTIFSYVIGDIIMFAVSRVLVWKNILILVASTNSLLIFICWYTPESPRWLINKNKNKEAYEQLNEISGLIYTVQVDTTLEQTQKTTAVLCQMFKSLLRPKMLQYFLIICLSLVISGFYYNSARLKIILVRIHTEEFQTVAIVAELLSYLFIIPVYMILGKRWGLFCLYASLSIKSIVALFHFDETLEIYYNTFGIIFGTTALNLSWLYFLDIFPTYIRATTMGCSFCIFGTTVAVSTFFMLQISSALKYFNYYITLVTLGIIGGLVLLLPSNTGNQDLPNSKL